LERSDLVLVLCPDTGESGDANDVDVQTGLITEAWLEVKFPSPSVSILPLDTAGSGDTCDAEVDNFLQRQFRFSSRFLEC